MFTATERGYDQRAEFVRLIDADSERSIEIATDNVPKNRVSRADFATLDPLIAAP